MQRTALNHLITTTLLLSSVLLLGGWVGGWVRPRPQPVAEAAPLPISVSRQALNFGEVIETTKFRHVIPIRNNSSKPLSLVFQKSCDCASVEPERATVTPHATLNLIVGLDLTHGRLRHLGQRVRPYVAHVTASWGDTSDQRVQLSVEGRVKAVLDTWPPNLHLKDWLEEGEPGVEESVTLKPLISLGTFYVKNTPAFLDVKIERQEKQYIAKVTPKANAPKGRFNTTIDFAIADKDNKPLPDHQLPVAGQVSGRYVWLPQESILGFQRVGESHETTLRIEGRRSNTFTIVDLIADKETSVEALGTNVYRVRQKIDGLGEQQTILKAVIRDADGRMHEIGHPIRWYASDVE